MAKVILFVFALFCYAQNFDTACMQCHQRRGIDLKKIYFDYLLEYSSRRATIQAMKNYLLAPSISKQLYKKAKVYKHQFDPKTLDKLLALYWDRYTVIGKIQ